MNNLNYRKVKNKQKIPFWMPLILVLAIMVSCDQKPKDNTPWASIFDGETLNGWTVKGGTAEYSVR